MGIKHKMMDSMMGNMSAEEKRQMMDAMMDTFFGSMTKEEKQKMMQSMMDRFFGSMSEEEKREMMNGMMAGMMGGGGSPMMGMMKNMMGKMMGGKKEGAENESGRMDFNPMEMCHKMMMNMGKTSEMASYATPEVRSLFEEWSEQIESEIFNFIKQSGSVDPERLSEHFKLSKNSINFFLSKLAQKGKIRLKAETDTK